LPRPAKVTFVLVCVALFILKAPPVVLDVKLLDRMIRDKNFKTMTMRFITKELSK